VKHYDVDRLIKASATFRNAHNGAVTLMENGLLICENCGTEIKLDRVQVENYLREGFPKCCVGTLKGGTMGFFRTNDRRPA
jgi:hypothetical protein